MKLQVSDGVEDTFVKDSSFAYKDGKIFDVFVSSKSYCAGNCLGRMRAIMDGPKFLQWIYPLFGGGDYEILDNAKVTHFRHIIAAFDRKFN